ncbi:MAG: hypothetical protein IT270_14005 [Saprospiraceae bacterium]|nr:hypothetical protein [Saprospiraceae bacterium]
MIHGTKSSVEENLELERLQYQDEFRKHKLKIKDNPPKLWSDEMLGRVVRKMNPDNSNQKHLLIRQDPMPAGYTYFGQFVTHDITYLHRYFFDQYKYVPSLSLHSIYGTSTFPSEVLIRDGKFLLHRSDKDRLKFDFLRLFNQPLMADFRNDQVLMLSQIHVLLLRLHNVWFDFITKNHLAEQNLEKRFDLAQKYTIWCYQNVLVEQYLKKIVHTESVVDNLVLNNQKFKLFNATKPPELMLEFVNGAQRFGHSQILKSYFTKNDELITDLVSENREASLTNASTFRSFPFEFSSFFENMGKEYQYSDYINTSYSISNSFSTWDSKNNASLARKDLVASQYLMSFHDTATKLYGKDALKIGDLANSISFSSYVARNVNFLDNMPLILYVLLEAECKGGGVRLGPLGSQILAEQILWTLNHDESSYLKQRAGFNTMKNQFNSLLKELKLQKCTGKDIALQDFIQVVDACDTVDHSF